MFQHDTISNILMRYNFFDTKYYLCILSWSIRSPMPHLRWPPNPSGIPSLILFPESVPVNGSGTLFWKIKDQGTMRAEKNFSHMWMSKIFGIQNYFTWSGAAIWAFAPTSYRCVSLFCWIELWVFPSLVRLTLPSSNAPRLLKYNDEFMS